MNSHCITMQNQMYTSWPGKFAPTKFIHVQILYLIHYWLLALLFFFLVSFSLAIRSIAIYCIGFLFWMTEFASPRNSMNDARHQHIWPSGGTGGFLHFNLLLTEATNVQSLKLSMSTSPPMWIHMNWEGSTPRHRHQNIQLWGISAISFKDFGVVYVVPAMSY